jgi:hypothetical protein
MGQALIWPYGSCATRSKSIRSSLSKEAPQAGAPKDARTIEQAGLTQCMPPPVIGPPSKPFPPSVIQPPSVQ